MTGAAGPGERLTVLLVDGHALVRGGVRADLETEAGAEVVGGAGWTPRSIWPGRASRS